MLSIPVIVSSRAYVSPSAQLQKGVIVEPLVGIHANVVIGYSSFISMGAIVNHNAVVLEGCHIDNNTVVMSGALVTAKTNFALNEVAQHQSMKFFMDHDVHIISKAMGSYP